MKLKLSKSLSWPMPPAMHAWSSLSGDLSGVIVRSQLLERRKGLAQGIVCSTGRAVRFDHPPVGVFVITYPTVM